MSAARWIWGRSLAGSGILLLEVFVFGIPSRNSHNVNPHGLVGCVGPEAMANQWGNHHNRAGTDLLNPVVQRDFPRPLKDGVDLGTFPVIVSGGVPNKGNMQIEAQTIGTGNNSCAFPAGAWDRFNLVQSAAKRLVFHEGSGSLLRRSYGALLVVALGLNLLGTGCARIDPTPAEELPDLTLANDPFASFPQSSGEPSLSPKSPTEPTLKYSGKIVWQGARPERKPWMAAQSPLPEKPKLPIVPRDNPYWPVIGTDGGVEGVVVALVGPKAQEAGTKSQGAVPNAAWKHGPLDVSLKDNDLFLVQDGKRVRVGLIRPEDPLTVRRESGEYDTVKFRGAAVFTAPLVHTQKATTIPVRRPGIIRLSSSAGHFWLQGQIIASPTPWITRTDSAGNFSFEGVPAGDWQAILYHPGWAEKSWERDGETLEPYLVHLGPDLTGRFPLLSKTPETFQMDANGFSRK